MKVLIGQFKTESNANVNFLNDINKYDIAYGDELIRKMHVKDIFENEGIEIIPSFYADAGPSYVISKETFKYIESNFINSIRNHLHEIDGIYLFLHGASYVEKGIGSGDFHILKKIREITGPYLPIFIACDPHGNLNKEYVNNATLIRSFRQSPHTDATFTKRKVAKMLCEFLKNRENIKPIYRKLPLILGGEQSVSTDEPVLSINKYMDEMELDPRIRSVSWHPGYLRHDCSEAGCGIVVVPQKQDDQEYCETKADELAKYIWDKRHEFHYTGLTASPEEALKMALEFEGRPVFITDSGDNAGSGASSFNTFILKQAINAKSNKSFLFANINDPKTYNLLASKNIGDTLNIDLGVNYDEMSKSINLDVEILDKGIILGSSLGDVTQKMGDSILIKLIDSNITVNVTNTHYGMVEHHQFIAAKINWDLYDIIVVKQGYIFPELKQKGKLSIMSLTGGPTPQDTKLIKFKRIMRPIYPIDEI